jgi:hypothetical protein
MPHEQCDRPDPNRSYSRILRSQDKAVNRVPILTQNGRKVFKLLGDMVRDKPDPIDSLARTFLIGANSGEYRANSFRTHGDDSSAQRHPHGLSALWKPRTRRLRLSIRLGAVARARCAHSLQEINNNYVPGFTAIYYLASLGVAIIVVPQQAKLQPRDPLRRYFQNN